MVQIYSMLAFPILGTGVFARFHIPSELCEYLAKASNFMVHWSLRHCTRMYKHVCTCKWKTYLHVLYMYIHMF